jgi:hypothetical protein
MRVVGASGRASGFGLLRGAGRDRTTFASGPRKWCLQVVWHVVQVVLNFVQVVVQVVSASRASGVCKWLLHERFSREVCSLQVLR